MELQKAEIYELIRKVKVQGQTIDYVQGMPDKFKQLPCISYCDFINSPKFAFKNAIYSQTMSVQIDIWSNGSSINTLIFKNLCDVMLENGWQLITGEDIERKGNVFRIMTKWRKIV